MQGASPGGYTKPIEIKRMKREQDIYSYGVKRASSRACHFFPSHTLVYLYGGWMHLSNQCGEALSIEKGDCAFIGRDSYAHLYVEPEAEEPCRMLFFSLSRTFLCEFYQTLDAACRESAGEPLLALHLLPGQPGIESFFHSLLPYILSGQELSDEVTQLKRIEITYALLSTDKRYATTLFDFTGTCRMNVFDLLKKQTGMKIRWEKFTRGRDNKLN